VKNYFLLIEKENTFEYIDLVLFLIYFLLDRFNAGTVLTENGLFFGNKGLVLLGKFIVILFEAVDCLLEVPVLLLQGKQLVLIMQFITFNRYVFLTIVGQFSFVCVELV